MLAKDNISMVQIDGGNIRTDGSARDGNEVRLASDISDNNFVVNC